jgi:hypothetical protein
MDANLSEASYFHVEDITRREWNDWAYQPCKAKRVSLHFAPSRFSSQPVGH